jgi:hypothetical protein
MAKSLIVAIHEAAIVSPHAAVRPLKTFTKQLALLGAQVDGTLELLYMRAFQAGYEQAIRDSKRGPLKPERALEPGRAERRRRQ